LQSHKKSSLQEGRYTHSLRWQQTLKHQSAPHSMVSSFHHSCHHLYVALLHVKNHLHHCR